MSDTIGDIWWLWMLAAVHFCFGILLLHLKSDLGQAIYFGTGGGLCIGYGFLFVVVVTGEQVGELGMKKFNRSLSFGSSLWKLDQAVDLSATAAALHEEVPEDQEYKKMCEDNAMRLLRGQMGERPMRNFKYPDYHRPPPDIPFTLNKFSDNDWLCIVTIAGFSKSLSMASKIYDGPNVNLIQAGTEFCCWGALFGLAAIMSSEYLKNNEDFPLENQTEVFNPFKKCEKRKAEHKKKSGNDVGEPCSSVPAPTKESQKQLTEEDWLEIRRSGTLQTEEDWMEIGRQFGILKQASHGAEPKLV